MNFENLWQQIIRAAETAATDPVNSLVSALIFVVISGLIGGLIAKRFRQPLILGYILAGVLIGIAYKQVFGEASGNSLNSLANIGVALLLFSMGLEFSKSDIRPIRTVAVWGTLIQVLFTFLVVGSGIWCFRGFFGFTGFNTALLFGVCFVSTSTAVILKTLTSNGQMGTLSSKVMIGMSIVQDLTVIPMMLLVCKLGDLKNGIGQALQPLILGAIFMLLMMTIGSRVVPFLLKLVARWNSKELFLLAVTALALGVGFISDLMQVSFSFGAFLAGIVLSDSDYGKKALYELMPVRDLFSMLFFVSIGMLLDWHFLISHWVLVLTLLAITSAARTLPLAFVTWRYGYKNVIPFAMFFGMVPTSEIAFVVINAGWTEQVFSQYIYSLILCVVVCSMILGPAVDKLTGPVYTLLRKSILKNYTVLNTIAMPLPDLRDHVLIAGGGPVARSIAHLLERLQLPYLIIDSDHRSFQECRNEHLNVLYGESQQDVILNAAKIDHAKILLSVSPGFSENLATIRSARMLNPTLPIITRADSQEEVEMLHGYQIFEIVQPKFEAGLEITRQTLLKLQVPAIEIQNYMDEVRQEQYKPLFEGKLDYSLLTRLRSFIGMVELKWVLIQSGSQLTGKSASELQIRSSTGCSIVGLMRDGHFVSNPAPNLRYEPGDMLAVIGTATERSAFEQLAGTKMGLTPCEAAAQQKNAAEPAAGPQPAES